MADAATKLKKAVAKTVDKYGINAASLGSDKYIQKVVPTPSLMLDYMLGIGGFPYGHMVEIFGSNGLGKTSALLYGILANVQRQGKLPALIAMEPTFDGEWAQKLHGLDPNLLLINRPDNAEEAFEMLYDLVYDGLVDYIGIDSVGAMGTKSEAEGGGKKAYGASGTITSGLNAVMPRLYKNKIGLAIINQQRQSGAFKGNILYDSPGGEALKHHAMIRIQLKPGKNRYLAKVDGENLLVGRELSCVFLKNKLAQAANKKAGFDFFHIETLEHGLGVDVAGDIINVGKLTGVITGSGWYNHPSFPGGKIQGKPAIKDFLKENPKAYETIRQEVMDKMITRELQAAEDNASKVAETTETTEEEDA